MAVSGELGETTTTEPTTLEFIRDKLGFVMALELPRFDSNAAGVVSLHDELEDTGLGFGYEDFELKPGVFVRETVAIPNP